ncbi:MAG TPA: response regulator transcription factor [Acidimicrobiales bacterium]|nr:response regulator transcription factor [Acidimicrobiales bacterium]
MGTAPEGSRASVLVVDDEAVVRSLLVRYLEVEGYTVEEAADAETALDCLSRREPDLVVLDVMLATDDGLDLLTELRQRSSVPVILLTARGDEADRVLGLKLGADDYVVKPFSPPELAARIASVLRRAAPARPPSTVLTFGDLSIDLAAREVTVRGTLVETTAREFDLLAFLAGSPRQVFTRAQLLDQVWGSSDEWQDPGTVTEHVHRLRRKIETDHERPRWLRTVRGVGYRFEP